MKANTPTSQNNVNKQPSHSASVTGGVLAVISLALSGIGYGLIHADYKSDTTGADTVTKAGAAVSATTGHVFSSLIGVPFLVIGIVLSILAVLFTLFRLTKIKGGGLVISVLWIFLAVWSFRIAIAAFSVIKAHS